jgi:hypothetical protein
MKVNPVCRQQQTNSRKEVGQVPDESEEDSRVDDTAEDDEEGEKDEEIAREAKSMQKPGIKLLPADSQ